MEKSQIDYKIMKEEHLYTSEVKLKFCGYGEWVEEADNIEIEYKGYQACVKRTFLKEPFSKELAYFGGHLCGYVRIPDSHPYFGKVDIEIDCHGGLTFNESGLEHWIGYDCAHSFDYVPTSQYMRKNDPELKKLKELFPHPEGYENSLLFNRVYRNMQFCIGECIGMINQLIECKECLPKE